MYACHILSISVSFRPSDRSRFMTLGQSFNTIFFKCLINELLINVKQAKVYSFTETITHSLFMNYNDFLSLVQAYITRETYNC